MCAARQPFYEGQKQILFRQALLGDKAVTKQQEKTKFRMVAAGSGDDSRESGRRTGEEHVQCYPQGFGPQVGTGLPGACRTVNKYGKEDQADTDGKFMPRITACLRP